MQTTSPSLPRPPNARGQGRKSVLGVHGAGISPVVQVVISHEQKAKFVRMGGSAWVRQLIEDAADSV